jgi:hypothetical protein
MRHIAVPGFAVSPCNGLIEEVTRPAAPPPAAAHRSLPILGADGRPSHPAAAPTTQWICSGCGQTWEREPLPDEAL